jgi:hypothetical protein
VPELAKAVEARHGAGLRSLRVQGINSSLDDIRIRGKQWEARMGAALIDALLTRTIAGASTLKLEVNDPNRRLLRHTLLAAKYDLSLDGLDFRYKGVDQSGGRASPLTLTHEALVVALLRELHGSKKVFRDKLTRAQFAKSLVREVKHPLIPFICPELDVIQPIATREEARERKGEAKEKRGKGLSTNDKLTVKGAAAKPEQVNLGHEALLIAESVKAPFPVMLALIESLIVETEMGRIDSDNPLQATPASKSGSDQSDIRRFLTGGWGVDPTGGGAIGYYKAHPDVSAGTIAQAIQGSAFPERYDAVGPEARTWVETFLQGSSTTTATQTLRYAFEEKPKEDNWRCISRLATEVNWRCFESAGRIFYIAEDDLEKSVRRMVIGDSTPGVEDTFPKFDEGKAVTEFRVDILARSLEAPPGSVAEVRNHGPCDGIYLVEKIESRLARRKGLAQVTLKRPTKPLPEPAPATKGVSVGFGASPSGSSPRMPIGAPPQLGAMLARMEELSGTPYVWGGGHGGFEANPAGLDCSGAISDVLHAGGYLDTPMDSGSLAGMFQAGKGDWFVLYANVHHVWCEVRTADGWVEWEEGGTLGHKAGFLKAGSQSTSGYSARHPAGL